MGLSDLGLGAVKSKARRFWGMKKIGVENVATIRWIKIEEKESKKEKGLPPTLAKARAWLNYWTKFESPHIVRHS